MRILRHYRIFFCLGFFAVLCGCVMEEGGYQDSRVYNTSLAANSDRETVHRGGILPNPVIVVHGLLGAQLVDRESGEKVWGVFSHAALRSGKFNRQLMYPMGEIACGNTVPSGLLERSEIQVMGVSFYLSNYDILLNGLESAGFVREENSAAADAIPSLFVFVYDWRRDISENAVLLGEFIAAKRQMLQKAYLHNYGICDYDVQFDIVAHSMGGLLAGYYLRYGGVRFPDDPEADFPVTWQGSKDVDTVVMIGTPNAGYADALLEICSGLKLSPGTHPVPAAVIATFPSMYQMIPDPDSGVFLWQEEHDIWDVELWQKYGWGLAADDIADQLQKLLPEYEDTEELRNAALEHLRQCLNRGKLFRKYMRTPAFNPPCDVKMFLIAGNVLQTNHTLAIGRNGIIEVAGQAAGDGKITGVSACYDLREGGEWYPFLVSPVPWTGVCYLQGGHMGIMNSTAFLSNLTFYLTGHPTAEQQRIWERIK